MLLGGGLKHLDLYQMIRVFEKNIAKSQPRLETFTPQNWAPSSCSRVHDVFRQCRSDRPFPPGTVTPKRWKVGFTYPKWPDHCRWRIYNELPRCMIYKYMYVYKDALLNVGWPLAIYWLLTLAHVGLLRCAIFFPKKPQPLSPRRSQWRSYECYSKVPSLEEVKFSYTGPCASKWWWWWKVREMDHEIPPKILGKSEGFFRAIFWPDIFFFHECIGCHVYDWICLLGCFLWFL